MDTQIRCAGRSAVSNDVLGSKVRRILLLVLLLSAMVGCGRQSAESNSNSVFVIAPYRHAGTWVFDDPSRGLSQEPFVAGIPKVIDKIVKDIPDSAEGFRLLFSAYPFPGHTHTLVWQRKGSGGNWYECPQLQMEGWLCSALLKYFKEAPKTIYFKAEKK